VFISATRLIAAWFPARRVPVLTQATGFVGQAGQLATAVPVAWVLHEVGWTPAFGALAVVGLVAAVVAALWLAMPSVSECPPGLPPDRLWVTLRAATAVAGTRLGFWSHFLTPFSANVITLLWGVPFFVAAQGQSAAGASALLVALTLSAMASGPVTGVLTGRHPLRRSWIVLGSACATAIAWIVLLSFSTARPFWQLAVFCVVLGAGGPVSLIGLDFARSWTPSSRLGVASGYVNIGGFASTVIGVLLVGLVLELSSSPGAPSYTLDDFRLAFAVLLPWLVGLMGVMRSRRLTRADLASEGVVVPPIREALRRPRRGRRWRQRVVSSSSRSTTAARGAGMRHQGRAMVEPSAVVAGPRGSWVPPSPGRCTPPSAPPRHHPRCGSTRAPGRSTAMRRTGRRGRTTASSAPGSRSTSRARGRQSSSRVSSPGRGGSRCAWRSCSATGRRRASS